MQEMKYTKDHEWIKVEGDIATVGITEHAAEALGELVYVELPEENSEYKKGDALAVVESSKSASDVYSPISGEVVEINSELESSPELVNNDTYSSGWIAKIKFSDESQMQGLMDEESYKKHCEDE